MRRSLVVVAMIGWASGLPATLPAGAQSISEDRLAAYEKTIQALQTQLDELKKEVASLRAAQSGTGGPDTSGSRSPGAPGTSGRPELFGYLQSQFETGARAGASRFLTRRARVGVRGRPEPDFRYEIQADLAASTSTLRNAFIEYTGWSAGSWAPNLRFGQFKLPYSLEAIESSTALPVIERSLIVDQLAVTHDRDTGVAVASRTDRHRPYAYQLSLTNGAGRNQFTPTRTKLFAGRVQLNSTENRPILGGDVALGFSTRQGHVENLNRPAGERREDERYGVDLDYQAHRWQLRGEYLWGRNGNQRPQGFYALASYRVRPALELVGRYEGFSADDEGESAHRTTLGLNYAFSGNTKAMLNYEFLTGRPPGDLRSGIRLRLQTVFP